MTLLIYIGSMIIGLVLGTLGCGIDDWKFWCILAIFLLPNAIWLSREWRRNK